MGPVAAWGTASCSLCVDRLAHSPGCSRGALPAPRRCCHAGLWTVLWVLRLQCGGAKAGLPGFVNKVCLAHSPYCLGLSCSSGSVESL